MKINIAVSGPSEVRMNEFSMHVEASIVFLKGDFISRQPNWTVVGFELWTLDSDTNYMALGLANVKFASFGVFLFFD